MNNFTLHTDGGSRGNPGPAGCGFSLESAGEIQLYGAWYLGEATNNQAEYCALIWGMQNALQAGATVLNVEADSELIVKQMLGLYKVKNVKLKPLYRRAQNLMAQFDEFTIEHVYRSFNKDADELANEAMDNKRPVGNFKVPFDGLESETCDVRLF